MHKYSSWIEIRLHTEFGKVWLCKRREKVTDGSVRFGFVVCGLWFVVYHRKIRPTQLWVELSWVVAIINKVSLDIVDGCWVDIG